MDLVLRILKTVPLFQSLSEHEHLSILYHINMQFYPAHYSLFKKGDFGESMYIIKSGTLRLSDEKGEIATLNEGDFFGEMALIESAPRMANAETLSDCEIFILKKEDFAQFLSENPEIAKKIQAAYESRKIENQKKL